MRNSKNPPLWSWEFPCSFWRFNSVQLQSVLNQNHMHPMSPTSDTSGIVIWRFMSALRPCRDHGLRAAFSCWRFCWCFTQTAAFQLGIWKCGNHISERKICLYIYMYIIYIYIILYYYNICVWLRTYMYVCWNVPNLVWSHGASDPFWLIKRCLAWGLRFFKLVIYDDINVFEQWWKIIQPL